MWDFAIIYSRQSIYLSQSLLLTGFTGANTLIDIIIEWPLGTLSESLIEGLRENLLE